jgi:hypothetical protein
MGGIGGSDRLPPVYASEDFVQKVTEQADASGMGFSEFGREAFQFYIEHRGTKRENEIAFELSERDMSELAKLSDDALKLDDPDLFAKMIVRRALDLGPEVVREFLLGQVKREVAARVEAENEARANTPTSSRKTRKAA